MTLQPNHNFKKPPRSASRSFNLRFDEEIECPVCLEHIELGSLVHYNPDGLIVHHRHATSVTEEAVCTTCFLIHAGECNE